MIYSVLNGDIMVQKGVFWTIGEHSYFVYYPIISYLRIKVYRFETMDTGRFLYYNDVSGKYNTNKYCVMIVWVITL